MKTHYVCTGGCGGVAEEPKVCETEGCAKQGELLVACDCTDNSHQIHHDIDPV
ncbi:MAG: hypothetical protein AAB415_02740 [Patescibacteria group bacterium]